MSGLLKPKHSKFVTIPIKDEPSEEMIEPSVDSLNESHFELPDQVIEPTHSEHAAEPAKDEHHKKPGGIKQWWHKLGKKGKVIVPVAGVLVLLAAGGTTYALTHHKPKPKPIVAKVAIKPAPAPAPAAPTTVASTLTGEQVAPDVNQRPITGVMIENSPDARPQSGLDSAGVVFEAVAEGGITRFLALFQQTQIPSYIGPVRSARPYYLQWCLSFDCALAHAGGSPEALSDIPTWGVKNLDEFAYGGYYQRISSRFAPHNLYTSMSQLNALETKLNYGTATFTGFVRKPDSPSKTPNAAHIDINISSADYEAHFDYDATSNSYKRSEGGEPHMQIDSGGKTTQIEPKDVVVLVMSQGIEADDDHTSYGTIGTGAATFFQDGTVSTGAWHKANISGALTFTDANGNPEKLNAGQTWITIVGNPSYLSYKS